MRGEMAHSRNDDKMRSSDSPFFQHSEEADDLNGLPKT